MYIPHFSLRRREEYNNPTLGEPLKYKDTKLTTN
jgi:hypothetical protein